MIAPLSSVAASLMVLAVITAPGSDEADCRAATTQYEEAVAKLTKIIDDYKKCVSESHGRNTCAAEVKAVDDAHDDFDDAVAEFGEVCLGQPAPDKPEDKPTADKPAPDKPADKSTTDKPGGDKPTADKPTADKPADKPATGKPAQPPAALVPDKPAKPKQ